MALRFRRSVKLGKGIRMNMSKRGIGLSFGTRGLRKTFHSTGRSTNTIGIPGTGLSYIKTNRLKNIPTKRKSSRADKINNEAVVEEYNQYIYAITHLHLHNPKEYDWQKVMTLPAPFTFGEIGPQEAEALANYNAYQPNLLARMFKSLAKKQRKQLKRNIRQANKQDLADYKEWEGLLTLAEGVLGGNADAYKQVIKDNPEFEEVRKQGMLLHVPVPGTVVMEAYISPKEVIPSKMLTLTKTGKVSRRKTGKTVYHKRSKDFVCGYALSLSRALFACLPIDTCVIHLTNNAISTMTGHHKDKVLLSVRIDKETLSQLNIAHINPSDAMENFEHRMNHLKTKGFRAVDRL